MTKEEALYQAKLVIEQLPEEEYNMLPYSKIQYINENYQYNENITINPDLPFDKQDLDEQTKDILKDLAMNADYLNLGKYKEDIVSLKLKIIDLEDDLNNALSSNTSKMVDAKELVTKYKDALEKANIDITNLKKSNMELYSMINKIPKFLRKIFLKQDADQYYLGN